MLDQRYTKGIYIYIYIYSYNDFRLRENCFFFFCEICIAYSADSWNFDRRSSRRFLEKQGAVSEALVSNIYCQVLKNS